MTKDEQTRARAMRFVEALHRLEHGDPDGLYAMVELFADDARLVNPAIEHAADVRTGPEAVRRFWAAYRDVLGDAATKFQTIMVDGDAAGLFWTTRIGATEGAYGAGGRAYEGATLLVFDEEGLVTYFRAYFDPAEVRVAPSRAAVEHEDDAAAPVLRATRGRATP